MQSHNAELQSQLATLQLNSSQLYSTPPGYPQQPLQANSLTSAADSNLVTQLTAENTELNAQLVQLSQQLEQGSSLAETSELQQKVTHLESNITKLTAQLQASEKSVLGRSELQKKLDEQEGSIKKLTTQLQLNKESESERGEHRQTVSGLEREVKQLTATVQSGTTEKTVLQQQMLALEGSVTRLTAQHESDRDSLKQEHQKELQQIKTKNESVILDLKIDFETAESEKETQLQELKTQHLRLSTEHEDELSSLTEKNKRLDCQLLEALAATTVDGEDASRSSEASVTEPYQRLQTAIQQLVQDKKAVSRLNEQLHAEVPSQTLLSDVVVRYYQCHLNLYCTHILVLSSGIIDAPATGAGHKEGNAG